MDFNTLVVVIYVDDILKFRPVLTELCHLYVVLYSPLASIIFYAKFRYD